MSEAEGYKLVLDYLDRVADEAQRRMSQRERDQLVDQVRDRIETAQRSRGRGPDAVRAILAREGSPRAQVDAFLSKRGSEPLDRAAEERAAVERARAERARVERAAAERAATERAVTERAAADRAAAERGRDRVTDRDPGSERDRGAEPDRGAERDQGAGQSQGAGQPPGGGRDEPASREGRTDPDRPAPSPGEPVAAPTGSATPPPPGQAAATAPAPAARPGREPVPAPPRRERARYAEPDRSGLFLVVGGLLIVGLLAALGGFWLTLLVLEPVGWALPRVRRGVKVVALVYLPFWLLPPFLVLGIVADWGPVFRYAYPATWAVLATAYVLWGARRLPGLPPLAEARTSDSSR